MSHDWALVGGTCMRCGAARSLATEYEPCRQWAVDFVRAWRDDDEELRIPMNDWGQRLADAIDMLLEGQA